MSGKINIFEALVRRMSWLGQRQQVLTQNLANADTPGYVPQDLKQGSFARMLSRQQAPVAPATTHKAHMGGAAPGPARPAEGEDQRERFETAPSGNAVVLEEQLIKIAETQMDYQTMTNLYRKHIQMLRSALGRSG